MRAHSDLYSGKGGERLWHRSHHRAVGKGRLAGALRLRDARTRKENIAQPAIGSDLDSGGRAKIQPALLVELLRSGEINGVAGHASTHPVARHVTQGSVLPGIRHGEYESAITAHKHVLRGIFLECRACGAAGILRHIIAWRY